MDTMDTGDRIAFVALLVAIATAIYTFVSSRESKRLLQNQANFDLLFDLEQTLTIDILALHNIDIDFLIRNNISIEELRYIVRSFRAGAAYYILNEDENTLSLYRKNLLNNAKVKIVYDTILRDKFIDHSSIKYLIDDYYKSNEYGQWKNSKELTTDVQGGKIKKDAIKADAILETGRLVLRSCKPDNETDLRGILSDKTVMEYVLNGPIQSHEFDGFIKRYFAKSENVMGLAVLHEKATDAVIGFAGLHELLINDTKKIELGFVISKKYQSKGYATEIGNALIDLSKKFDDSEIFATVDPDNKASIFVLEKKLHFRLFKNQPEYSDRGNRLTYHIEF